MDTHQLNQSLGQQPQHVPPPNAAPGAPVTRKAVSRKSVNPTATIQQSPGTSVSPAAYPAPSPGGQQNQVPQSLSGATANAHQFPQQAPLPQTAGNVAVLGQQARPGPSPLHQPILQNQAQASPQLTSIPQPQRVMSFAGSIHTAPSPSPTPSRTMSVASSDGPFTPGTSIVATGSALDGSDIQTAPSVTSNQSRAVSSGSMGLPGRGPPTGGAPAQCGHCGSGIPSDVAVYTCLLCSTAQMVSRLCVWCFASSGPVPHPHDKTYFATESDPHMNPQTMPPGRWTTRKNPAGRWWYTHTATGLKTHIKPTSANLLEFAGLPPGWEERQTPDGKILYMSTETGQSSWTKPPNSLPPGWRELRTPDNVSFYVHPDLGLSTWDRPGDQPRHRRPILSMNGANSAALVSATKSATKASAKATAYGMQVAGEHIQKLGKKSTWKKVGTIMTATGNFAASGMNRPGVAKPPGGQGFNPQINAHANNQGNSGGHVGQQPAQQQLSPQQYSSQPVLQQQLQQQQLQAQLQQQQLLQQELTQQLQDLTFQQQPQPFTESANYDQMYADMAGESSQSLFDSSLQILSLANNWQQVSNEEPVMMTQDETTQMLFQQAAETVFLPQTTTGLEQPFVDSQTTFETTFVVPNQTGESAVTHLVPPAVVSNAVVEPQQTVGLSGAVVVNDQVAGAAALSSSEVPVMDDRAGLPSNQLI